MKSLNTISGFQVTYSRNDSFLAYQSLTGSTPFLLGLMSLDIFMIIFYFLLSLLSLLISQFLRHQHNFRLHKASN